MADNLAKHQHKECELKISTENKELETSNILEGLKKELNITREH